MLQGSRQPDSVFFFFFFFFFFPSEVMWDGTGGLRILRWVYKMVFCFHLIRIAERDVFFVVVVVVVVLLAHSCWPAGCLIARDWRYDCAEAGKAWYGAMVMNCAFAAIGPP